MSLLRRLFGLNDKPAPPPICADTGAPKHPGNCWNVRCQLGGVCCRVAAAVPPPEPCWLCEGAGHPPRGLADPDPPCRVCGARWTDAAGVMVGATIDTADHVKHGPTGETWVVARVNGEHLHPCGWPPTRADLKDCTLVKKATPAEREKLLRDLFQGQTEHAGWAADALGVALPDGGTDGMSHHLIEGTMTDPSDDDIEAWADSFIKQNAYNRAVAVQIATAAAKWVRGQRVHVGWYYEMPAHERTGLRMNLSHAELAEFRRVAHVWPAYRVEREAVPGAAG